MDYLKLKDLLLIPLDDAHLVKGVRTLSENFTTQRDRIGEYVLSKELVSAYARFYLPTNIPKMQFLLENLSETIKEDLISRTFIDFGSGPGTYSLAICETLGELKEVKLIDQSQLMLDQAKKILDSYFPNQKKRLSTSLSQLTDEDILFFGNSLNEMEIKDFNKLLGKVNPKYIAFIEPGTREFFKKAIEIRQLLSSRGYQIHYPCPSIEYSCPLLKKEVEDWCHQVIQTTHDSETERISQMAKLDRRTLPFIAHFYEYQGKKESKSSGRLIRFLKETKFSFNWELCIQDNNLKTIRVEVMKKGLDKKAMKKISVGALVEYKIIKQLDDRTYRVELVNPAGLF